MDEYSVLPETTKVYLPIIRAENIVPPRVIEDATKHFAKARRK